MNSELKAIKVGLLGLGNIGTGTVDILRRNADLIESRLGVPIELVRVADLNAERAKTLNISKNIFTTNAEEVVNDPNVQVVIELIGGIEPARSLMLKAMDNNKHIVTANKALLAIHWDELVTKAEKKRISFSFEASVGGGIPLIVAIRRGLVANHIKRITGIINGTCNYILSRMASEQKPFAEVLAQAQANGFAEANPALDVDGIDAAQKLAILIDLCFDTTIHPEDINRCGITQIIPLDLTTAAELGYRMKLICSATNENNGVEAWVHPTLVPIKHPLASVEGVFNAVYIEDDNLGPSLYFGRGAGALPTGSAIVADLISASRDILSGAISRMPISGVRIRGQAGNHISLARDAHSEFYIRVTALDQPGVLANITGVLGRHNVSIASFIQRGRADTLQEAVPVIIVTHEASYTNIKDALKEIDTLPVVKNGSFLARIISATAEL
ncbi:MAG: homoserine dehydrogenase [Deltaproteobacteria bacterium]|nr:homoserine dehydrogenase [Deltaproteobacteria bacterium]